MWTKRYSVQAELNPGSTSMVKDDNFFQVFGVVENLLSIGTLLVALLNISRVSKLGNKLAIYSGLMSVSQCKEVTLGPNSDISLKKFELTSACSKSFVD